MVVVGTVGLLMLGNLLGMNAFGAFAQSPCSSGDHTYMVVSGDTLGVIASRYGTSWEKLPSYNHIANPNVIYLNQKVCIPGKGSTTVKSSAPSLKGMANLFPYGQCTWYANQRFTNSMASTSPGQRMRMPGHGRAAPTTSTGMSLHRHQWGPSSTCSRGYRALTVWDTSRWWSVS